jgi:hypothetical protein
MNSSTSFKIESDLNDDPPLNPIKYSNAFPSPETTFYSISAIDALVIKIALIRMRTYSIEQRLIGGEVGNTRKVCASKRIDDRYIFVCARFNWKVSISR